MNIVQFNALKPGDKIENAMSGSTGEVVEADSKGVSVRWSSEPKAYEGAGMTTAGGVTRHYSRYSTIWFHWSLVEGPAVCGREDCRKGGQCFGDPTCEQS